MGSSNKVFYGTRARGLLKNLCFKDKNVLDLGAGYGEILYSIKDKLEDANSVVAVEICKDKCEVINKNIKTFRTMCVDATNTGLPDNCFDIIICNQVIEHIEDEDRLISEIHRMLAPGGVCFLGTVFKDSLNMCYYRNRHGDRVLDPTHVREYTDNTLVDKFRKYFYRRYSQKEPLVFAITDFILPRLGIQGHVYENSWILRQLRRIKLPIIGCYNWEFLLWKQ